MPRSRRGRPRGQTKSVLPDDAGFGGDDDEGEIPAVDLFPEVDPPSDPAPELIALGPPPADAAGIQKWNYQMLSMMAWLVVQDRNISDATRMKRAAQLTQAAARHYPEAARKDLSAQIARDAEEIAGRKRAKAAARLTKAPAAGGAKVIPSRREV